MDRAGNRETLKRQAVAALDEARLEMSTDFYRAQRDYSPQELLKKSFVMHRAWWLGAAAVGGFAAVGWFFRPQPRVEYVREKGGTATAAKSTLLGLAISTLWPLARGPLLEHARNFVQTQLEGRFMPQAPKKHPENES